MKYFSRIAPDCKFSEGFAHVFSYINGSVAELYSSEGPGWSTLCLKKEAELYRR